MPFSISVASALNSSVNVGFIIAVLPWNAQEIICFIISSSVVTLLISIDGLPFLCDITIFMFNGIIWSICSPIIVSICFVEFGYYLLIVFL